MDFSDLEQTRSHRPTVTLHMHICLEGTSASDSHFYLFRN